MKYILILSLLVVAACSNNPIIVPDTTGDNVVMLQLKDRIAQPGVQQPSFGWLFWYIPIAAASLIAAWRYLIKKPILCDEDEDGIVDQKKPKQVQDKVE